MWKNTDTIYSVGDVVREYKNERPGKLTTITAISDGTIGTQTGRVYGLDGLSVTGERISITRCNHSQASGSPYAR